MAEDPIKLFASRAERYPQPTEADIRDALAHTLCRCGSHARVVAAVLRAAREG